MGDHFKKQCVLVLIYFVFVSSCLSLEISQANWEKWLAQGLKFVSPEKEKIDTVNFYSVFVSFSCGFVLCYLIGLRYLYRRLEIIKKEAEKVLSKLLEIQTMEEDILGQAKEKVSQASQRKGENLKEKGLLEKRPQQE
ncbi:hypothetical protein H1C71_041341, partial [Ictidomys tridecemlineatus]